MEADLDVMPGLRCPSRRIAVHVRAMPVRATAHRCPLPAVGIDRALRAEDHRLATRHHLVQIQLEVRHLGGIDDVDIGIEDKVRGVRIVSERIVPAFASPGRVRHVKLACIVIQRSSCGVDGRAAGASGRPFIVLICPVAGCIEIG